MIYERFKTLFQPLLKETRILSLSREESFIFNEDFITEDEGFIVFNEDFIIFT